MSDVRLSFASVTHSTDSLHVEDLTFALRAGEAYAVLGPVHSGKTELLRLCHGVVPAQQGEVLLLGQALHTLSEPDLVRVRSQIAFLQETPLFLNNVRFYDNLALPLRYHSDLGEAEIKQRVDAAAERAQIGDFKGTVLPMTYSRRYLKRATYARALTMDPKLLVIESVVGLIDDDDRPWLLNLLRDLKRAGVAMVMSSRTLEFVERICDQALVLDGGRVVATGTPKDVLKSDALKSWRERMQESS